MNTRQKQNQTQTDLLVVTAVAVVASIMLSLVLYFKTREQITSLETSVDLLAEIASESVQDNEKYITENQGKLQALLSLTVNNNDNQKAFYGFLMTNSVIINYENQKPQVPKDNE